jgi:hypothetical protein
MPKKSRRPKARAKKPNKPSRAARARKIPPGIQAPPDNEAYVDGCDLEFNESEVTPDSELPMATGGVESLRSTHRRRR